jgi:hypothetical protein
LGIDTNASAIETLENAGYITSTLTESQVDGFVANNGFAAASDIPDVSDFITADDLPDVSGIDTNASAIETLENAGYITSTLTEEQVDGFVANNGYLTEVGTISYNDLSNKPSIPDVSDFITADDLPDVSGIDTNASAIETLENAGYITSTLTEEQVDGFVANNGYLTEVGTISYNDLSNKPSIPDVSDFITADDLPDVSGIDTNASAIETLENAGYITSTLTEEQVDGFVANNGYLTEVGTISYNDLSNKPSIPDVSSFITADDLPDVSGIDTNASAIETLENAGYITSTLTESQV